MADIENVIEVTEASFERDVIQRSRDTPVVVDFWAPWCGPCRMLGPVLERLAHDPGYEFILAKLNVDENPQISMQYQVQGIPAVKAFVGGQVVSEFVGALPEPRVRQFLEKLSPSEADQAFQKAQSLLATKHYQEAEAMFRDLQEEHPAYPGLGDGLARALLAQGKGCEALELLEQSTDGAGFLQARRLEPLARFLCNVSQTTESEASSALSEDETLERQYIQAGRLLKLGNLEAALDGLLDVLRQDKGYLDGEAKHVLLAIFELMGDEDTRTQRYRRELASILF